VFKLCFDSQYLIDMQLARWSWPARKSSERERSGERATFCSSRSAHACSGNSDVTLFQLVFSYRHVVGENPEECLLPISLCRQKHFKTS